MAKAPAPRKPTTAENLQATLNNPNVRKFLDMLSAMEGTTTHGYNTTFGGGRVESLDRHPNIQREFRQTDGKTNSSGAFGRYGFLFDTWKGLQQQYPEQTKDMGQQSQDFGAVALIANRGALQDVVNGRFGTAVLKVGAEWASLPTSPYPQARRSWDDVNKALGLQVPAGGARAANAQALTPEQGKKLYDVYKAGRMSPEQRADYERDFATIQKPAGATMLRAAAAPTGGSGGSGGAPVAAATPAQAAQATAKTAPYVLPIEIIMAYNDGSMNPQQRAEFERDYKAGAIAAPRHIPFKLKGAQPAQGYLGRVGDSLSNLGSAMGKEGGGGSMLGLAEGVAALGSGLFGQVVGGVAALPDLATGSLTGRTGEGAAATVKLAQDTFTYQPRTPVGQAALGLMGTAVGEPLLAAQQGIGGVAYSTTGDAMRLAQSAGLPISDERIDKIAAGNAAITEGGFAAATTVVDPFRVGRAGVNAVRGRPAAMMPPPIDAVPVAATAAPFSTPATVPPVPARPAPLATNPAEAMPRPVRERTVKEAPPTATSHTPIANREKGHKAKVVDEDGGVTYELSRENVTYHYAIEDGRAVGIKITHDGKSGNAIVQTTDLRTGEVEQNTSYSAAEGFSPVQILVQNTAGSLFDLLRDGHYKRNPAELTAAERGALADNVEAAHKTNRARLDASREQMRAELMADDPAPRPATTLTPENPTITIQPDGVRAAAAPILSVDGKPFPIELAAQGVLESRGLASTHKVQEVAGGYAIVAKDSAAQPKPLSEQDRRFNQTKQNLSQPKIEESTNHPSGFALDGFEKIEGKPGALTRYRKPVQNGHHEIVVSSLGDGYIVRNQVVTKYQQAGFEFTVYRDGKSGKITAIRRKEKIEGEADEIVNYGAQGYLGDRTAIAGILESNDLTLTNPSAFDGMPEAAPLSPATARAATPDPITDPSPTNQPIQAPAGTITTVGEGGLNVMHGSTRADLTADQIQVINPNSKQGKRGRVYGGFYATTDAASAQNYANMGKEGSVPTVYDVQIKPGSKILDIEGVEGITRLTPATIERYRAGEIDVVRGTSVNKVEYAIINPEAVGALTPRAKPAAPKTTQGKAFTTSQKPVAFEYDVVPIESVVKSTNADLTPNTAARPELQPRNRDTDASTAQINTITNLLNPEWLAESPKFSDGAPTVFGNEAVAGHGRLAAIERRYAQGVGDEYRQFIIQKAAELGINPARLAGVERPVLVRRVKDETDAQMIAQDSNAPTTLRMTTGEQARIDAKALPDLGKLKRGEDGEMNIPASYDFVRDFMGKLPVAERGDLMDASGRISQTAVRRIQAAVAEKAYKDPDLIARFTEATDADGKRISAALQKQAGAVAALAESAAKGESYPTTIGADLAQAANKYADIKAAGSTVREYLDQGQLVDDGLSVGAREALAFFGENANSGRAISEYIQGKIAEVEAKGNPMQDSLFQKNKPQAAAIGERIAAQAKAAGRPAKEAKQAGKLAEAYYAATAKALGLTPDEVFAKVGLTVESGNVGGANAALRLGEREHSMVFGENANASSFVHEAGHHFLETHAKLADESPKIQADVDAVMTWAGHDGRAWSDLSASQKREVHEKFAESFEQYLLTGKSPTKGLKGVFENFKQWLTDVYTSLAEFAATNPRADLSPEVMAVMDRMLGGNKAEKAANSARGKNRKKSAPVTDELLDFKRSAPVAGGVSPALHQARYDVLRDIGLTDGQIRGGSVEGDLKRLEWDAELAKYDTEYGVRMKEQLELERQKLREYGDGVVESMGGTPKATPETRGAAIVRPLEAYQAWYREKIKAFYKLADEQGAMTGGIELRGLEAKLKEDSAYHNEPLQGMRKSVRSFMFEQRLLDARGNIKPMSAKQAETVRKHLNSIRTFETGSVISELNALIDESVFSTLNRSVYGEARAVNTQYHRIFSDPKGIATLLKVDGINRTISHEKVAANVAALAETNAVQFRHIMKQLESMPTPELQKMADQAIGEIRAQIAEKITAYDSTKPDTVAAIGKALAPYRGGKLREIFGEKGAQKLETFVAAHGILRKVDAQPSGTSSMTRNVIMKLAEAGTAMVGGGAGLTAGGAYGAAAGTLLGQQIGARIKGSMVAAVDKKSYGKAMSPRQLETMRQSYDASGRRLAALPETEAATAAAQAAPDSARARVTNGRLERSKEWIAFYAKLTDEQKAAVKKIGAAAWLLSVSGLGDNQTNDDGENR